MKPWAENNAGKHGEQQWAFLRKLPPGPALEDCREKRTMDGCIVGAAIIGLILLLVLQIIFGA